MAFKVFAKKLGKRNQRFGLKSAGPSVPATAARLSGVMGSGVGTIERKTWRSKNVFPLSASTRAAQGFVYLTPFTSAALVVRAGAAVWDVPRDAPALTAAGPNAFAGLVQTLAGDRVAAIDAIRVGFPAAALKDAGAYFDVPTTRIRTITRVPETTAAALAKRGANLDAAASERLWRLADLVSMVEDVFEDSQAARDWMRTPNKTFLNTAPMDYLDTEPGAMAVRQVLNAIATGGAA